MSLRGIKVNLTLPSGMGGAFFALLNRLTENQSRTVQLSADDQYGNGEPLRSYCALPDVVATERRLPREMRLND